MGKTFFIIDGSSCIYRAFHAITGLATSKGLPTNATYGFIQTLRKILKTYEPDYMAIAFDVKGPSFRHELFPDYKAERPSMPDELSVQIPYIKRFTKAFNVKSVEMSGFEADDLIAALAKKFSGEQIKIVIVTGDKDMFQLVRGDTVVLDYGKDKEYGRAEVEEKIGVPPELVADFMALSGDQIDNIPGVKGVGPRTASKLVRKFGSIEDIYERIDEVEPPKLRQLLKEKREDAFLSKRLAMLSGDVALECGFEDFKRAEPDYDELERLLGELEFLKLAREMVPEKETSEAAATFLTSIEAAGEAIKRLSKGKIVAVILERDKDGEVLGIGLGNGVPDTGYFYAPCAEGLEAATAREKVFPSLKRLMEDPSIEKVSDDAKAVFLYFLKSGISPKGVSFDSSIASYLLNPASSSHTLETVCHIYLGERVGEKSSMSKRLSALARVVLVLRERLASEGCERLFFDVEMPLIEILARMEIKGIKADRPALLRLSEELKKELDSLEKGILEVAGYSFNLNSPKQLAVFLFEKLGLKPVKKTKTGYSTDEGVLTALSGQNEVVGRILAYRQWAKLKSTYVDGILELIDSFGRVHTSFNQTITATGRLSSSNPNLQNIPVKGGYAGRIREAFVPESGSKFLSADYSQIELRLVAHLSEDPLLLSAFEADEDVHTRTASEVFSIEPSLVTSEMRRRAKAINFGIIYGMGPHGLATELSIPVIEAKAYIDAYFEHYKGVREFVRKTIERAKELGYTTTLLGRRRYVPELASSSEQVIRLGERLAVNSPVQGGAADIIKAAMVAIHKRFIEKGFRSELLLQIHDELVFEVLIEEIPDVERVVREEMEGIMKLKALLKVNISIKDNWGKQG
ncbi:MAG: DNA polymerase I [Thermodesulfobacteriota bacterium]